VGIDYYIINNNHKLMTTEQKIVQYLAKVGLLTQVGMVDAAMADPEYAKTLMTGDGLEDEVREEYGENIEGDCDHESLTNEEIQEVFDNDEE
jgi:hypothetical protein